MEQLSVSKFTPEFDLRYVDDIFCVCLETSLHMKSFSNHLMNYIQA